MITRRCRTRTGTGPLSLRAERGRCGCTRGTLLSRWRCMGRGVGFRVTSPLEDEVEPAGLVAEAADAGDLQRAGALLQDGLDRPRDHPALEVAERAAHGVHAGAGDALVDVDVHALGGQ